MALFLDFNIYLPSCADCSVLKLNFFYPVKVLDGVVCDIDRNNHCIQYEY